MKACRPEGSPGAMMLNPSAAPPLNQRDDRVRDLVGRTGELEVAAAAAEPRQDLPDGQVLPHGHLDDQVGPALGAFQPGPGQHRVGQRGVELEVARLESRTPSPAASRPYSGTRRSSNCRARARASASVEPM